MRLLLASSGATGGALGSVPGSVRLVAARDDLGILKSVIGHHCQMPDAGDFKISELDAG
jgi:hypothetical protein